MFPILKDFLKLTAVETVSLLKQEASDMMDDFLNKEKEKPYTQKPVFL
jgi:hypothetical protein